MRNETISLIIAVIMCSMVVIALVLAIIWNIKKKTDGFKRVISTVVSVLLVIAAACNLACYRFSNVISTYFAEANATEEVKKQVADNSYELVKELVGEGAVLLENKDAALPLDEGSKLNVFGQYSVSLTYGGSGSGGGDETDNITLQQGLESAGFEINSELTDLYNETIPEKKETDLQNMDGGDYMGREPDISKFSEEILENAKNFSDTALIVLSRNGREGWLIRMHMI